MGLFASLKKVSNPSIEIPSYAPVGVGLEGGLSGAAAAAAGTASDYVSGTLGKT